MHKLDLNDVVDGQRIGRVSIIILMVVTLVLVSDGFDLAAMGLIGPELIKEWHITPAQLVPAFSAAIIGMMVGGPVLGTLGDRFGRKRLLLYGLAVIGAATLATMAVRSTTDLVMLRFLTGLGLGGVVPNVVALIAELAPFRHRGRMIVIATAGMVLGMSLSGLVMAVLGPQFGWRAILFVGGTIPLIILLVVASIVPESIKYLVLRGGREDDIRRIARRLRPDLHIASDTIIALPVAVKTELGSIRHLFAGDFLLVTPLLWISLAPTQMASFFAVTWLPTLLRSGGASASEAQVNTSLFSIGGLGSSLLLLFIVDRLGVIPLVLFLVAGAPLLAVVTLPVFSPVALSVVITAAGFCILGAQQAIVTLIGLLYPTVLRSSGAGVAQGMGRLGSLSAPVVGGILLYAHVRIEFLPLAPALLLLLGAIASAMLALLCRRRFGGFHPDEFPMPQG